ncbi:protein Ups1p, mitochondrial [Monosporozyma unispora]|nr:hypothetical protein C6P44_003114 [Kazachstania unispora]
MVLIHSNKDKFYNEFECVTGVVLNKYQNPYVKHILSIDTIDRHLNDDGTKLFSTRLICKKGKLPMWVSYLIGATGGPKVNESWLIEHSVVDSTTKTMQTYVKNLDHVKYLQVIERTTYQWDALEKVTNVNSNVTFTCSAIQQISLKSKIENMAKSKFEESVKKSRVGMSLVMQRIEALQKEQV